MRSAVVLLGFLLASAQAFYIPAQSRGGALSRPQQASGFLGQQAVSRRSAPNARRATLVASLEDIEKKIIEQEKAATAAKSGKKAAAPAPAPKAAAPAPAPKAKAAAPKPAPVAVGERDGERGSMCVCVCVCVCVCGWVGG